jgi:hypothetical protein
VPDWFVFIIADDRLRDFAFESISNFAHSDWVTLLRRALDQRSRNFVELLVQDFAQRIAKRLFACACRTAGCWQFLCP